MDEFYTKDYSFQKIHRELMDKIGVLETKNKKTMNIVILISTVFTLFICFLLYTDSDSIPILIIPIVAMTIINFVTNLILKAVLKSGLEKNVLFTDLLEVYNQDHGTYFEYTVKPKIKNDFNKSMGLFPFYAGANTKFMITGQTPNHHKFTILKTMLLTSSGNTTQVHFDGFYTIYDVTSSETFQIRSKGKPGLKKTKFRRISQEEPRQFVLEDSPNDYINPLYLNLFEEGVSSIKRKQNYIASNKETIDIATEGFVVFNKVKTFSLEEIEIYYNNLSKLLNFVVSCGEKLEEY